MTVHDSESEHPENEAVVSRAANSDPSAGCNERPSHIRAGVQFIVKDSQELEGGRQEQKNNTNEELENLLHITSNKKPLGANEWAIIFESCADWAVQRGFPERDADAFKKNLIEWYMSVSLRVTLCLSLLSGELNVFRKKFWTGLHVNCWV